jgi:hypothetical protein
MKHVIFIKKRRGNMNRNKFSEEQFLKLGLKKSLYSAREHYPLLKLGLAADQAIYNGFC